MNKKPEDFGDFNAAGVATVKEIGRLFRDTNLTLAQIATEVGLDSVESVRLLWVKADEAGLLDHLGF